MAAKHKFYKKNIVGDFFFKTSKWRIKLRWRHQQLFFSFPFSHFEFVVNSDWTLNLAQNIYSKWIQYSRWRFNVFPSVHLSLGFSLFSNLKTPNFGF
jgi:hypothetical protein